MDPHLLQAVLHLPNTGKVKATALLEKFGSEDVLVYSDVFVYNCRYPSNSQC